MIRNGQQKGGLGCRGGLDKVEAALKDPDTRAQVLALRLAVLLHHARRPIAPPRIVLEIGKSIRFGVPARWLAAHPLTAHLLDKEVAEWAAAAHPIRRVPG